MMKGNAINVLSFLDNYHIHCLIVKLNKDQCTFLQDKQIYYSIVTVKL